MDDDDVPPGPAAAPPPPQLPAFSTFPPTAAAASWPAAAAGAMLGGGVLEGAAALAQGLDECDVWDVVDEKDDMDPVVGVDGEEDDLMLDMLRSQQDGQFIIGGESVLVDPGLVPEFAPGGNGGVGGDGAGEEFAEVARRAVLEEIALNSASVEVGGEEQSSGAIGNVEAPAASRAAEVLGAEVVSEKVEGPKVVLAPEEVGFSTRDCLELGKGEDGEEACKEGKATGVERAMGDVEAGEEVKGLKMEQMDVEEKLMGRDAKKVGVDEEEVRKGEVEGEVEAVRIGTAMDVDDTTTHLEVDVAQLENCKPGDAFGGDGTGDVVMQKAGEMQVGDEAQSAIFGSEMAAVSPSTITVQEFKESVEGEAGDTEPGVGDAMELGGDAVHEEDHSRPLDGNMSANALDMVGASVQGMDDSQFLEAIMPAVGEARKEEDPSPSVPDADTEAAVAEGSQSGLNQDLGSSMNVLSRGSGRKKRGRQPKAQVPKPTMKKGEEDVCFICFDGGNLVVCDRRGCPKVYHPACINRDEAFFKARGRWNCGWHICSVCEKAAHNMCYTCTYSLCKGCMKQSKFVCIRGNKGLCETCRPMVMLIETNDPAAANFYDKTAWDYLFKDYWMDVKQKLSLTFNEITKGKKSSKKAVVRNEESSDDVFEFNEAASTSDSSSGQGKRAKKRSKKRPPAVPNEESSVTVVDSEGSSFPGDANWASKELLEFVSHMRGGDATVLSQYDVQALLLEYIKQNKLRDPRRKSQIICDDRLSNLFGKARVGHFEMLKLLESHFLVKEASNIAAEDDQLTVGDPESSRLDAEGSSDAVKITPDRKRKGRRKEDREHQTNFDDYAAIDVHNISLVYLRRNLMEELLDDAETFDGKVVNSFVRIRIPATGQKQDMYRLVKVVGTTKAAEKYQAGKRTTDIALEILNLNKKETISIDIVSNQEFTEEECKRLRQSIKYGLIPRMTVGDLHEKARDLQSVRANDWLEIEKARLGHLRDRASETGRRKQLRECVEKLEFLPEEHARRLIEIPDVHSDPHMDPDYESAEEEPEDHKLDKMPRHRGSGYFRKAKETGSSEKGFQQTESWSGARRGSVSTSETRNVGDVGKNQGGTMQGSSWGRGRDVQQHNSLESQSSWRSSAIISQNSRQGTESAADVHLSGTSVSAPSSVNDGAVPARPSSSESEKIWHYQDPSGKIQGPFSMVQLRKWNSTGYFPRDLRVWKTSEKQEDSILLTDALIGKFEKDPAAWTSQQNKISQSPSPTSLIDSRDTRDANWKGGSNDSPWVEKKLGVQDHGGTWTPARSTSFQSNGPSYDRQTHPTSSPFQQLPAHAQQGNMQPTVSGFGSNTGLVQNNADRNSPAAFGSNMTTTTRGNQSRTRVSRWEPESGSALVHGAQPSNQTPVKPGATTSLGNATSMPVTMDSPTPRTEHLRSFPTATIPPQSTSSTTVLLPAKDAVLVSGTNSLQRSSGVTGQDKSHIETVEQNPQLAKLDLFTGDPNANNFSPIRGEASGNPHLNPIATGGPKPAPMQEMVSSGSQPSSNWIASADTNAAWSMPSPTPTSEAARVDSQTSRLNNPSFSDGGKHLTSGLLKPDSSVGPAAQHIIQQGQQMAGQSSNWCFSQENSAINAMAAAQATTGWGTQLPANANVAWVAPGTLNVGWNAAPQANANVVGWVPTAGGTQVVNAIPQVAGPGTLNPAAGWGTVAQVVPQANASWGSALQPANPNPGWTAAVQGYPNANPGWGQQPANPDANMGWGTQLPGNPNANANANANVGWAVPNGNTNANWGSPTGNQNARSGHPRDQKERYGRNNGDSGPGSGRHRMHSSGGSSWDSQGKIGICKFHESGHCKKGSSCNFLHT